MRNQLDRQPRIAIAGLELASSRKNCFYRAGNLHVFHEGLTNNCEII